MDFVFVVTRDSYDSSIIEDIFLHERDAEKTCKEMNNKKRGEYDDYYNYEKFPVRTKYE